MLNKLHIQNFKSLRDVTLNLGRLNVFVGANASGKSNILDALRVLQGIGNSYSISEILNGKPKGAINDQWSGIRGGSAYATFMGTPVRPVKIDVSAKFTREFKRNGKQGTEKFDIDYSIGFDAKKSRLTAEHLYFDENVVYNTGSLKNKPGATNFRAQFYAEHNKPSIVLNDASMPILSQLSGLSGEWEQKDIKNKWANRCKGFLNHLADTQRIEPLPTVLREYTYASEIGRMGEHGENFAGLIKGICRDSQLKAAYLTWLQHLRPDEVEDVGTIDGAVGDSMFAITEGGKHFPAPTLSDGTLRFAALAAVFFQPDMPAAITIEEPENGIHPNRLRLLMELLREQSARTGTQVFITTHSPVLLDWLQPKDYAHTFFCRRNEEDSNESKVRSLADIPLFNDVVKQASLGELFAEGWLEDAL